MSLQKTVLQFVKQRFIGSVNFAFNKLGVTAVAGAAAANGAVEITWPIAAIAMVYIAGRTAVDT